MFPVTSNNRKYKYASIVHYSGRWGRLNDGWKTLKKIVAVTFSKFCDIYSNGLKFGWIMWQMLSRSSIAMAIERIKINRYAIFKIQRHLYIRLTLCITWLVLTMCRIVNTYYWSKIYNIMSDKVFQRSGISKYIIYHITRAVTQEWLEKPSTIELDFILPIYIQKVYL